MGRDGSAGGSEQQGDPTADATDRPPGTGSSTADADYDDVPVVVESSWRGLAKVRFGLVVKNLRRAGPRMLMAAGAGFAIGWLTNLFLMAFKADGFNVRSGGPAAGQGNLVRGMSFWFVASFVVSAIVSHRITVGREQFWDDVRTAPDRISRLVREDGDAAAVHALFGFAGGTLITRLLGPSLGAAVAVGLVVALATVVRPLVVGGLMLAWRWIVGRVAPANPARTRSESVTVSTLGAAGAMAVAVVVPSTALRFLLGLAAVVVALVLSGRIRLSATSAILLVLGGAALFLLLAEPRLALADDGGWQECGASLTRWLTCSGTERVMWLAMFGGGASGAGAGLGSALEPGGGRPPKAWTEMTEDEKSAFRQDYIRRWKEVHPDATSDQLQRFVEGLDSRPPGFWEKRWDGFKNFWDAYAEDVASGKQAEGLGGTFYGMYNGFTNAAEATWNELKQLDDTLAEFPGVFWDDLSSGAQRDRLKGMVDYGENALKVANDFYSDPDAMQEAYDKFGPEVVDEFMMKMGELERSLQNADPTEIREKIGEIAGTVEFEVLIGAAGDKGTSEMLAFVQEARQVNRVEKTLDAIRDVSRTTRAPDIPESVIVGRNELLERAQREGRIRLTPEEADKYFGIDEAITLERQGTILQYSEGAADEGVFSVYKLSDDAETSLTAKYLRNEHPDQFTGKWNPVSDKGFKPGEEVFMSPDDLRRFQDNPLHPGETINFKPRELSDAEFQGLSRDMQERYLARQKDAAGWDNYTGYSQRKTVDYSDPKVRERYGEMWVEEDPGNPVAKAEFWKDPKDNRVYVRYQTKDGTWHPPKRQASDIDTVTHGGGERLTYEQSRDLQYSQSRGQLGEGDTAQWGMSMLEEAPGGGYVIKDPANKDMLVKAIDSLRKAESEMVLTQNADGLFLERPKFPELENLADAARRLDQQGGWDPQTRATLQSWGVIP